MTYRDLFSFINNAKRSSTGIANPTNDDTYNLHIYNGFRQVNIHRMTPTDRNGLSICNITFDTDDETIRVYRVVNGVADYSSPIQYNFDDSVSTLPNFQARQYLESILS